MWVLGNFATGDEVKKAVEDIVMVATPMPGLGSAKGMPADVHFFVQDKTGKSIAIEPRCGVVKVTDAPLGVMTNAPTYDWHMTNLDNYIKLSPKDVDSAKLGPVTLESIGSGTGMLGLPGDFTPPSRFVRAAMFSQAEVPNANAEDAVFAAFHILNQFDIPRGSVVNASVGGRPSRDHRVDQCQRPSESALVLPHLPGSEHPRRRPQGGDQGSRREDLLHRNGDCHPVRVQRIG